MSMDATVPAQSVASRPPSRLPPGRLLIWGGFAAAMLIAPLIFTSSLAVTMLCQIGIAIVACLSYNMLLGQGGMLSFGHAVYSGLATFVAIHALIAAGDGSIPVPVTLIPLVGGFAGMFFAVILGYVTTKKAGTPFAMITLGLGELVFAMSLMIPEFFGGEGGVTANRVVGKPLFGLTFGPPLQVYYLLAVYTFICTAAMFAFTRTPLGRMLNAVRDNPERVEFIGYSTQRVRYISFILAGFFAGVAGGCTRSTSRSRRPRSSVQVGPGCICCSRSSAERRSSSADHRRGADGRLVHAVLRADQGLAALPRARLPLHGHVRAGRHREPGHDERARRAYKKLGRLIPWYLALIVTALVMLAGAAALIELVYHLQLGASLDPKLHLFGMTLDTSSAASWLGALAVALIGFAMFDFVRRRFARVWGTIQARSRRSPRAGRSGDNGLRDRAEGPAQVVRQHRDHPRREPGRAAGRAGRDHRPERRRQVDPVQPHQRPLRSDQRRDRAERQAHREPAAVRDRRLGLARSFQITNIFGRLSVFENLRCGVLWALGYKYAFWKFLADLRDANERAEALLHMIKLDAKRETLAMNLTYAEQRALEIGVTIRRRRATSCCSTSRPPA
jgi:branched-chain amino acid transport system permease protein